MILISHFLLFFVCLGPLFSEPTTINKQVNTKSNSSRSNLYNNYIELNRREDDMSDFVDRNYRHATKGELELKAIRNNIVLEAKRFFSFASVAYCSSEKIKKKDCKHCSILQGYTILNTIEKIKCSARVFIAANDVFKEVVVSISFEKYPYNYKSGNLKHALGHAPADARVDHLTIEYTKDVVDSIEDDLKAIFNQAKYKYYLLTLTGHNYGGVISVLAAPFIQKITGLPKSNFAIFTFGQPKVGNPAFNLWFNKQFPCFYRIVNKRDIFPHRPSIKDFHHAGQEIFINEDNDAVFCLHENDKQCSSQYLLTYEEYNKSMGSMNIEDTKCLI